MCVVTIIIIIEQKFVKTFAKTIIKIILGKKVLGEKIPRRKVPKKSIGKKSTIPNAYTLFFHPICGILMKQH